MKRVLYVENDFGNIGGSIRSLHRLVRHMDRDRYEAYVTFRTDSPSPMIEAFEGIGCRIVHVRRGFEPVGASANPFGVLSRVHRAARRLAVEDFDRYRDVVKIIRRQNIDLVHANTDIVANRYAVWAAKRCRIPIICHQRSIFRGRALDRSLGPWIDVAIAISRFIRDSTDARIRPNRLDVVYNGVEIPAVEPALPGMGPNATIAAVGRLTRWKGQHVFLRAAARLKDEFPGVRFLVVGAPVGEAAKEYERELRRLSAELRLENRLEFVGHVRDMEELYRRRVDVVVHTAVEPEPFGLVLVEAMAANRPIVASNSGACAEIVQHGTSGLLFSPGDDRALAEALAGVLSNTQRARALANGGFQRVRDHFDIRTTADKVQAIYRDLLEPRAAS